MSRRRVSDWLSGYMEYAEETEPPKSYHTWIALSNIASTLQRRVHIRWGLDIIYPNMYVVLVGPSGKCRKGTAMRMGYEILKNAKVKVASESIIREALIRNMKDALSNFIDPRTRIIHYHSSMTVLSEELSVFLGQNNIKFLADLTDWYDCKEKWTYETKNSGTDTIQGMCLNMLGATAADWLVSILPQEAVGGGFTSRIIFVVEEDKRRTVAKYRPGKRVKNLIEALQADLQHISTLAGELTFSPEAEEQYCAWYEEQDINTKRGNPPIRDPRFAGYCERRATHLRKLAMLFSISRSDDMIILPDDVNRALAALKAVEVKMPKVFGGLGTAKYSQVTEKILAYLTKNKKVTRSDLLANFYRDLDMETLELIERTLVAMHVISTSIDPVKGETYYKYIGKE